MQGTSTPATRAIESMRRFAARLKKGLPPKPDIDKDGGEAFAGGWGVGANPWMSGTHPLEYKEWLADWHAADADAFRSFVEGK